MNFKTLQDLVSKNIGRTGEDELIKNAINLGLERVAIELQPNDLNAYEYADIEQGSRILKVPKVISFLRVMLANGKAKELKRLTMAEYDSKYASILSDVKTGEPKLYTTYGKTLELFPIPEKTYTLYLRYIKRPEFLVNDEDECPISYNSLVIAASTVKSFSVLTMPEEASYWHQIYNSELSVAKKAERSLNRDTQDKVRGFSTERNSVSYKDPRTVI